MCALLLPCFVRSLGVAKASPQSMHRKDVISIGVKSPSDVKDVGGVLVDAETSR